ncbi:DNA-3-methyladenine glycosylase I [Shewanella sp. YIC-542]|uniref:DNA-3-methyladenine glycosylase I n=1 Tax=Shewanella mytili TaxID=3377111 RepID=UPI00398F4373
MQKQRCGWVSDDPLYQQYHDEEWGRPVYDSQRLFAKLCLDGQQAGLSWLTVLRKQHNYEAFFAGFNPQVIAAYDDDKVEQLLQNPGIIRNRAKVKSIIQNARAYVRFTQQGNDFSEFLWGFVGGTPQQNHFTALAQVPAQTAESQAMSKALKKLGFNFCGPTICYAFMQAVGMVNDHLQDCCCYPELCGQSHNQ